jgi:YebC/PmpR family DNA-binding regulatory protein
VAGHSKWAQIKRKKAVIDSRRGKLFTRLQREITVAARLGGGDPAGNSRLRAAIQEAKASNVPNDNIERAIKKGTGELEGESFEEAVYEGYGPGGVAVLVEVMTDNRNRTVSELRHLFSKHDGNLGESGCVSWMFEKRGFFAIDKSTMDEESFLELAVEQGAEDMAIERDVYEVYTSVEDYTRIRDELEAREIPLLTAQLAMLPQSHVQVGSDKAPQMLRLLEALEDHDDVQHVWANCDIDESVLVAHSG